MGASGGRGGASGIREDSDSAYDSRSDSAGITDADRDDIKRGFELKRVTVKLTST